MQGYDKFFKQAREANNGAAEKGPSRIKADASKVKARSSKQAGSPEAQIKKMMEDRLKEKKAAMKRKRAPFPKGAMAIVLGGLVLAGAAMLFPETFEWVGNHVQVGFMGEASAAEQKGKPGTTKEEKSAAAEKVASEKPAATDSTQAASAMPDTTHWTQEELSFFNKLSERKLELDAKEAELAKLEEELQKQRVELDEKLKQLESMRGQIAQTLKARVDEDKTKVTKLVEVYSGMKPVQAAKVIETINEDLAVQVLDRMKKKSASDILNVMSSQKAQRLSEMLAGYKRVE
jgi:flagellar motility protein MotE (MotC chaperone)